MSFPRGSALLYQTISYPKICPDRQQTYPDFPKLVRIPALGLAVRVVKTPTAGRQPRYGCVASPEFHIWGVCYCMYILPLQCLYLCNCFNLWRLPTEFKCRGIDKKQTKLFGASPHTQATCGAFAEGACDKLPKTKGMFKMTSVFVGCKKT